MGTGQKYLLDIIADHANEAGECWPSVETLHLTIERSRSVTFEYLDWLESNGFITRHKTSSGRNWYQVHEEPLRQMQLNSAPAKRVQKLDPSRNRTSPESGKTGPKSGLPQSRNRTSIKQPPSNHQEPPPGGGELPPAESVKLGRGDQFAALDARRRKLIEPYLDKLHPSVELERFADFVDHRSVCRKPLSIGAWNAVSLLLNQLAADGHDLNESLKQTLGKGLCEPIVPRVDPGGANGFRPQQTRANDDFSQANYGPGTAPSDLPKFLQSADDITSA